MIVVKDKDGELVERRYFGWSTSMPGGTMATWGLELGDRVEKDGYCLLRVTSEARRLKRPPPTFRLRRRRRLDLRRRRRQHGRPRGR